MERRFQVMDGDGEVIRTFVCKADASNFMASRPEFKLVVRPKPPKEKILPPDYPGDALL